MARDEREENEELRERLRAESEHRRVNGAVIVGCVVAWTFFMLMVGSLGHEREQRFDFAECLRFESRASCEAARDAAASSYIVVVVAVAVWIGGLVGAYLWWQDVKSARARRRQYPGVS